MGYLVPVYKGGGKDPFLVKSYCEITVKSTIYCNGSGIPPPGLTGSSVGSIGVFQGDLSPLSSRSVVETCVMPVLLFGSENWLLNRAMISSLEAFQGEIAKRILIKWPGHHSNTAAVVVVGLQSVESRILERKLGFLHRVLESGSSCVSGRAVEALSDNTSNSCLVKECEEL